MTFWNAFSLMKMYVCRVSLKSVPKVPNSNIPALGQIMAYCRPGDKPSSEPVMVRLLMHIWVTRPQWVKKTMLDRNQEVGNSLVCLTLAGALLNDNPLWIEWLCQMKKMFLLKIDDLLCCPPMLKISNDSVKWNKCACQKFVISEMAYFLK